MNKVLGFLLLAIAVGAGLVRAGNAVGNGMDQTIANDNVVWFAAQKPINGCVEVSSDFGVDTTTAQKTITQAFATWSDYFDVKGISKVLQLKGLAIATQIQLHEGCTGSEDLAFYLGVKNEAVVKAMAKFHHPLAFAERTIYDSNKRWGQGFIWLAPPADFGGTLDWSQGHRLLGALLHELGHIYGSQHTPWTIMSADLSQDILDGPNSTADSFTDYRLSHIDSGSELYLCNTCAETFNVRLNNAAELEHLIGRTLALDTRGHLDLVVNPDGPTGTLTLMDAKGQVGIRVRSVNVIATSLSGSLLFQIPELPTEVGFSTRTEGKSYLATLEYKGRSVTVVWNRNIDIAMGSDNMKILDSKVKTNTLLTLERNKGEK